jgi:hypothetical protein
VDRSHRAELPQLLEDGRSAEVAGVDDQVGDAERLQAGLGKTAVAPRQVRVGDDRELNL